MSYRPMRAECWQITEMPSYDPDDIGPAIAEALTKIAATGGGFLCIEPLADNTALKLRTPVNVNMGGTLGPAFVGIEGNGCWIEILLSDITKNALNLVNCIGELLIQNVTVTGTPGALPAPNDCASVFRVGANNIVTMRNVAVWGVKGTDDNFGVAVTADGVRHLSMEDCFFVGCGSFAVGPGAVVVAQGATQIFKNCQFYDFDTFQGSVYSKNTGKAHILINGHANDDAGVPGHDIGYTELDGCFFDTEATRNIWLHPTVTATLDRVVIKGCNFNTPLPPPTYDAAINCNDTRSLVIEDSIFTFTVGPGSRALTLDDVDYCKVLRTAMQYNGKQIVVGPGCGTLDVEESVGYILNTAAAVPTSGHETLRGKSYPWPFALGATLLYWFKFELATIVAGKVSSLPDESGTGDALKIATQATAGKRPTWTAADPTYNSRPSASFNSANPDFLRTGTWAAPVAQPFTLFLVGNDDGAVGTAEVWQDVEAGGARCFVTSNLSGNPGPSMFSGALGPDTVFPGPAEAQANTPKVIACVFDKGFSKLFVNSLTPQGVGIAGAQGYSGATLGATFADTAPLNGKLVEGFIVAGALSDDQIEGAIGYLVNRYALPAPASKAQPIFEDVRVAGAGGTIAGQLVKASALNTVLAAAAIDLQSVVVGVAQDTSGAGANVRVARPGQIVQMLTDGAGVLAVGDPVTISAAAAGRVVKQVVPGAAILGRVVEAVGAVADTLFHVSYEPGIL